MIHSRQLFVTAPSWMVSASKAVGKVIGADGLRWPCPPGRHTCQDQDPCHREVRAAAHGTDCVLLWTSEEKPGWTPLTLSNKSRDWVVCFFFFNFSSYSFRSPLVGQCHVKGSVSSTSLGDCRPPLCACVQELKFSALGAHERTPTSLLSISCHSLSLSSVLKRPFAKCIDFPCL